MSKQRSPTVFRRRRGARHRRQHLGFGSCTSGEWTGQAHRATLAGVPGLPARHGRVVVSPQGASPAPSTGTRCTTPRTASSTTCRAGSATTTSRSRQVAAARLRPLRQRTRRMSSASSLVPTETKPLCRRVISAAVLGVAPLEEHLPVERITVSLEASEAAVNSGKLDADRRHRAERAPCGGLELAQGRAGGGR